MKDQMIVQNFINTFHFIHWINQPTLSETIPFDNTAFMTAKQIWIENIKDTSQQAVELKNKAQQLMRVLQYDFDGPESQYDIKSKNNQTSIYKYKNKFIKQVSPLNKYKEQSAASVSIDVITRSTKEKNIKKRTQNEHKLMQDQQYKQEQTDKQINISKQRLKIQSKQIQIELKSKDDRKQKQKNGIGRPNFRDENIDHSNNQILKQFCTQKPNFYQTNTQMEEYQNNFQNKGSPMQKQPIYFATGNKYSPEFPNKLKSKPITKIVQLNKMQYKKQVPYLSQINKVYINQSMEANPTIIQSANTKLKDKAQCIHINQCCHSCDRNCSNTNMDKIKNKQFNEQDNLRECQRTRNRIKSINLKSNYNKKQERNHSYYDQDINYDNGNKDYFVNNKLRGRTYTQSIQSDPNSIISEHKHFIKTPGCRKINKISRVQFSKTQNMSSDNYGSITHPQYLNSQPQIQTQDAKCHNKTYQYPYRNFNQVKNRQSQKQKAQLFQDDLDLDDHDFMQQQIIREKMEALEQQHMKEEQEKIQYGRKQLMEKEERKTLLEMERIRKINEERQRNKKLQQKQRIENERQQRQQKKRQNNLLHKLREQFSSIGQQEHNEEEKKVSDEIKQLEVKLNEIISNNHKSRRNYQDYSPSAKVVKLNLTPSRSNIQRNNAMNCNKTQTPRASTNKSNTLLTKKISCLNSRVI